MSRMFTVAVTARWTTHARRNPLPSVKHTTLSQVQSPAATTAARLVGLEENPAIASGGQTKPMTIFARTVHQRGMFILREGWGGGIRTFDYKGWSPTISFFLHYPHRHVGDLLKTGFILAATSRTAFFFFFLGFVKRALWLIRYGPSHKLPSINIVFHTKPTIFFVLMFFRRFFLFFYGVC